MCRRSAYADCEFDHDFVHIAKFKCTACGRVWTVVPGPDTKCKCGSLYAEWLDYPRFAAEKAVVYAGVAD